MPISITNGWFIWAAGAPVLRDVNLEVKRGEFVAVIGGTGAGKSSLLSAMLNDVARSQGTCDVIGSVGYVPQLAWV